MDSFNQIISENPPFSDGNLFFSHTWQERLQLTKINAENPLPLKHKNINIYSTLGQELADYEEIPKDPEIIKNLIKNASNENSDWLVFRKLRAPEKGTLLYSHAPYLDLTKPIETKKEAASHIARTERKLTREIGPVRLLRAHSNSELETWFSHWKAFHTAANHFDEKRFALYHQWIFGAELPDWIRPLTLMAGENVLACGLFYQFESVFYYFSPAQTHAEEFRKYGIGKIFTQKLIEEAKLAGCIGFDFLQGAYPYKMTWNPRLRPLYQKIIPLTFYGHIFYYAVLAKHALRSLKK